MGQDRPSRRLIIRGRRPAYVGPVGHLFEVIIRRNVVDEEYYQGYNEHFIHHGVGFFQNAVDQGEDVTITRAALSEIMDTGVRHPWDFVGQHVYSFDSLRAGLLVYPLMDRARRFDFVRALEPIGVLTAADRRLIRRLPEGIIMSMTYGE